jgi:DNA-binding ferritin-like protein
MRDLTTLLRAMQLYAHNCHNTIKGPSFFADHEYLGELYPVYEVTYDSVVERVIGLGFDPDLSQVTLEAASLVANSPMGDKNCFQVLLVLEQELCAKCQEYISTTPLSEGTKQLLGDICDKSEARQYQLRQRVK